MDNRGQEAIDPASLSPIEKSRAQIRGGEYAADAEIEDIYNSVGL